MIIEAQHLTPGEIFYWGGVQYIVRSITTDKSDDTLSVAVEERGLCFNVPRNQWVKLV